MKKYIIIGLLLLFVGTVVIVPMLKKDSDEEFTLPATFLFKEQLGSILNIEDNLEIQVNSGDIEKLELVYNDSVFKTWKNPKGILKYRFNSSYYGLGTRPLSLISTLKNGQVINDDRFVRVLSDVSPMVWTASVVASFPHLTSSYTQGFEFNNGILYEGTGQYGESMVAQVNLNSGVVDPNKQIRLDENYFGEGITVFGDQVYQLTWKEQKCFVYDKSSMKIKKDISYIGEGWGLCNDGKSLIMSDGSERITFRNPETFAIERIIEVYDDHGPISKLNELEYIDGMIYANIYTTNKILVIDPNSGKVNAIIDGTAVEKAGRGMGGEVMNGIAYNPQTKKIYFTGKNWEKVLEIKLDKPNT